MAFCKELRRGDRLTVGRIDSRYTGKDRQVCRSVQTTTRA